MILQGQLLNSYYLKYNHKIIRREYIGILYRYTITRINPWEELGNNSKYQELYHVTLRYCIQMLSSLIRDSGSPQYPVISARYSQEWRLHYPRYASRSRHWQTTLLANCPAGKLSSGTAGKLSCWQTHFSNCWQKKPRWQKNAPRIPRLLWTLSKAELTYRRPNFCQHEVLRTKVCLRHRK